MPKSKIPHDPNHFVVVKTGPWEGPGSWLFKVFCAPCGFEELATCRDDAYTARSQHRGAKVPQKAKDTRKAAARKRVLERQEEEEVEWEVFF